jgi:MFS family permease
MLSRPPADIAWIGSVQVFLLFFIGTFTGRLTDAGFFRPVFFVGSVVVVASTFATSFCSLYWQFFLSQGILMGLGNGCLFCPALSVVSTYFNRKRALAIGIVACGSATGGLVFPAMVRQLLPQVGFPWTMRSMGFIQLSTLIISNVCLKPRIRPRKAGRIVEWGAFKELDYTFYATGAFFVSTTRVVLSRNTYSLISWSPTSISLYIYMLLLHTDLSVQCFWGVYYAFFYLAAFSRDGLDPGLSYTESLNLLMILNGIGIIGRIVPNYIADRVGPITMFVPTAFIAGLITLCWMGVTDTVGIYVWSVFYGIAGGAVQGLFPAGLSSLTTDLRKQGTRMGMVFTIVSFAVLTGPPIAGSLISAAGGKFWAAHTFAGLSLLVGTVFLAASRLQKTKQLGSVFWQKI